MGTNKISYVNMVLGYIECPSHVLFRLFSLGGLD